MKFSPVTSLLIGLVLFLPSPLSTAQQNGGTHRRWKHLLRQKRGSAQAAVP
jgi:hypothetical protein